MRLDEKLLDEIVCRVTNVVPAERIILFGSAATDEMTPDSDIDILVLQPNVMSERDEWIRIREALRGLGYPFDIVLMTTTRFEETRDVIGGLAYPASKTGRVIYDAA